MNRQHNKMSLQKYISRSERQNHLYKKLICATSIIILFITAYIVIVYGVVHFEVMRVKFIYKPHISDEKQQLQSHQYKESHLQLPDQFPHPQQHQQQQQQPQTPTPSHMAKAQKLADQAQMVLNCSDFNYIYSQLISFEQRYFTLKNVTMNDVDLSLMNCPKNLIDILAYAPDFNTIHKTFMHKQHCQSEVNLNVLRWEYLCLLFNYAQKQDTKTQTDISNNMKKYVNFDAVYPYRIFQIGCNKCGTVSLEKFFHRNNIPSVHRVIRVGDVVDWHNNNINSNNSNNSDNSDDTLLLDSLFRYVQMDDYEDREVVNIGAMMRDKIFSNFDTGPATKDIDNNDDDDELYQRLIMLRDPWYLDTFVFYSDFQYGPMKDYIIPLYFEYKRLESINMNKYNSTFESRIDLKASVLFSKHNFQYQKAFYWYKQFIFEYKNSNSYFILNIRNIWHFLLSKARHEYGKLLTFANIPITNWFVNQLNDRLKVTVFDLKLIDIIKVWYVEFYLYNCRVIKEFSSNKEHLLIFDIELDPIDKLIHFLPNLSNIKLSNQGWQQEHATNFKNSNLDESAKNYVFTHEPYLDREEYFGLVDKLTNISSQQSLDYPNYVEETFLKTNMCPKYFWTKKQLFDCYYQSLYVNYNYSQAHQCLTLNQWNQFWKYLQYL